MNPPFSLENDWFFCNWLFCSWRCIYVYNWSLLRPLVCERVYHQIHPFISKGTTYFPIYWITHLCMYIVLRQFLHMRQYRDKRKPEVGSRLCPILFCMTSRFLYSSQYHIQHCKLRAFELFGKLYMHNHGDKYPGFEPGTSRLQAPVDTNEPTGSTIELRSMSNVHIGSLVISLSEWVTTWQQESFDEVITEINDSWSGSTDKGFMKLQQR